MPTVSGLGGDFSHRPLGAEEAFFSSVNGLVFIKIPLFRTLRTSFAMFEAV